MYSIKIKITQVIEGENYSFEMTVNNTSFTGNLNFGVPISELDNQKPASNKPEDMEEFARRMFVFDLTFEKKSIEISLDIFAFLIQTVGKTSIDFYNNNQSQGLNTGVMGQLVNNGPLSELFGATAVLSLESTFPTKSIPNELAEHVR